MSLACILLAMSILRSRSRPALKVATLPVCCSGSVEAIKLPAPLFTHPLECLTGLSDPIHHVCDYLTEAIDLERVDKCSPLSHSLLWFMIQPLALLLWPSPFSRVDIKECFLHSSHTLESLPGCQCSLEGIPLHILAITHYQHDDHEVQINKLLLFIN